MSEQWQNTDAGPRQVDDLNKAIRRLRAEGQTFTELYGVIGGDEHSSTLQSLMGPVRAEVAALDEQIRGKYGHQVTRATVRAIIADYEAALPKARESRPVDDQRRTPEADAELSARMAERAAAERAEQDKRNAVLNAVTAKAPAGAHALIVAELCEDASDPMTDYFSSRTVRSVAIGWRFGKREDFRQLRAAAGQFPEAAHLATERDAEHRDNYSMGAGNYLSDHGSARSGSGWVVKSHALPCRYLHLTEDAIPDTPASAPATAATAASSSAGGLTVSPSSLGKAGVIELRFDGKPGEEVREALKRRAGFRWSRFSGCWYGELARYVATGAPLPPLPQAAGVETASELAAALAG